MSKLLIAAVVHESFELLPFLSLAAALEADGWSVAVAAHGEHEKDSLAHERIKSLAKYYRLEGEPQDYIATSEALRLAFYGSSGGSGPLSTMKQSGLLKTPFDQYFKANAEMLWRAANDHRADAIVCCTRTMHEMRAVGQRLNVPVFVAGLEPCLPSAEAPPPAVKVRPRFGFVNRLVHWGARQLEWVAQGDRINRFRRTIGLPEVTELEAGGLPTLMLFSAQAVPRPSDWSEEDVAVVGFVGGSDVDDDVVAGNASLKAFLDGGAAPVVVHFGALPVPRDAPRTVAEALDSLTLRGILCGRWVAGPSGEHAASDHKLGDHVFVCDQLPVAAMPRCAAAVHEGNAVVTGLALRAGLPQAVLPLIPQSFFWAQRCELLGVGPPDTVPLTELTAPNLIRVLSTVNNETTRTVAANLADRLRGEDALARSCAWIRARFQLDRNCGIHMPPDGWVPDDQAPRCSACHAEWTFANRRHHCRGGCGGVFCVDCLALDNVPNYSGQVFVCKKCFEARNFLRETGQILIQD